MGHDDVLALPEDELSGAALRLVHRVRVLQDLQDLCVAEAVPLVSVVVAVLAERSALCPLFDRVRDPKGPFPGPRLGLLGLLLFVRALLQAQRIAPPCKGCPRSRRDSAQGPAPGGPGKCSGRFRGHSGESICSGARSQGRSTARGSAAEYTRCCPGPRPWCPTGCSGHARRWRPTRRSARSECCTTSTGRWDRPSRSSPSAPSHTPEPRPSPGEGRRSTARVGHASLRGAGAAQRASRTAPPGSRHACPA